MLHAACCALLLTVLAAVPAPAQWVVDASAGGAEHDPVAASVGTRSAILGVRYEGPRWLYLSGGAPLDSEGLPWMAAGAGGRLAAERGPVGLGVDLSAQAHAYRARALGTTGAGLTLGALPFVAWAQGPVRAELRSGLLQYGSTYDGVGESRWLHESGLRLVAQPSASVLVEADGRYLRAEEGDYPFVGAGVEWSLGRGTLSARAGRWLSEFLDEAAWGVGGRYALADRTEVYAALEQEAPDPLYWSDARRRWSVGVTRSLGGRPERPAPAPVIPVAGAGRVEIRLPLSEAEQPPAVAGDFSGWEPVAMRRSGDAWTVSLALEPGVYHYAFQRPDGSWFVPESVPNRVDDGFGGHNAVLVVSAPGGA